jgi:hypothetical protein
MRRRAEFSAETDTQVQSGSASAGTDRVREETERDIASQERGISIPGKSRGTNDNDEEQRDREK